MEEGRRAMFHLGWFLGTGFGVYGWNQQWSGNAGQDMGRPGLFADMAAALERAGFDYMMLEDSSVLPDIYQSSFASALKAATVRFDPLPLVPLLTARTKHIGVIATAATTFYPPFLAARLYQSLDHLTEGRVGLNLVTASPHAAAQNYGHDQHFEHDLRYEMADEWMRCVSSLWESWEPEAVLADEERGVYADASKVHAPQFEGRWYSSRGPLTVIPGPQRRPVICQAGGSPAGRNLGAAHADTIVSAVVGAEAMKAYRDDISERMLAHGRKPTDVKVLYLVDPVLADTDEEAEEIARSREEASMANIDARLAGLSYVSGQDFSKFDLDAPFPEFDSNGHQSTVADFRKAAQGKTLREVVMKRRVSESVPLVGSPETVADLMTEAMDVAGGDGFLVATPPTRRSISLIADGLAPVLRRRGLIRAGYDYPTFRENLLSY